VTPVGPGWELLVERLGLHLAGSARRTYGRYQVFRAGRAAPGLNGFMCECIGPGDNGTPDTGLRIEPGRYPLWTQFGRYRSIGYSADLTTPGLDPMPGFRLEETGARTAILIHPGHPPNLYLSSVGCLNPTRALSATEPMDYWESRARVIALIEDLRAFAPGAFTAETNTRIDNAFVVITGEPMTTLEG
jgi:hypothetical protein